MRVVLDTNILISALLVQMGHSAAIYRAWQEGPDPTDDFLLALSETGQADYLVTGDKSGLLALAHHRGTWIVSAREFAALFA
jgi:predicted nucleic acid-binding protein